MLYQQHALILQRLLPVWQLLLAPNTFKFTSSAAE